ncbi:MAG: radical SAM protein [Thermoplasmata archaeon]|nr:MAG: radical SAM protein [Thermoplasmata archaeon]
MEKKLLLLSPSAPILLSTVKTARVPLWAGVLAGLTPQDSWEITFIQGSREKITEETLKDTDLVALSTFTPSIYDAYKIGDLCRKKGIPCVMGGIHSSFYPKESLAHCDSVVVGDAEPVWGKVLGDFINNKLQPIYHGGWMTSGDIPLPDRSIFSRYRYSLECVEFARGCPNQCEFCSVGFSCKGKFVYKNPKILEQELESIDKKFLLVSAPNLLANPEKSLKLIQKLKDYNFRWMALASIDIVKYPKIMDAMAETGCFALEIGFESFSDTTLKSMGKYRNLGEDYQKVVQELQDRKIETMGSFIYGWDTDDRNIFKESLEQIEKMGIDFPVGFLLVPYPTTNIFLRYKRQGRILTEDWSRYSGMDVVYQPKLMSRRDLLEGYLWLLDEVSQFSSEAKKIFSRARGIESLAYSVFLSYVHGKLARLVKKKIVRTLEQYP